MKLLKEAVAASSTEEIIDRVSKALADARIYPDIWPTGKDSFAVSISWGDWKHDHLYADKIIEDTLGDIDFSIEKEVTEEDGSDTYSAIHNVTIYPPKANLDELEEDIDTMPSMEHTLYVLHNIIGWERDYSPKDLSDVKAVAAACHIYDPDYSTQEFLEAIEYYDLFDDEGNVISELNEDINAPLYHYSDTEYKVGDIINKTYKLSSEVIDAYKDQLNLDPEHLIHMLDHKDEDYANTYKYCYEVEAPETRKAKMDFCPVLCQDYLDRINKKYLPEEIAKEFAKMYAGYEQNSSLLTLLGLEPSDKEEFIADSNVKVIRKCDESLTEDINIVSLKQEIKQAVRERFSGLDEEDYNDLIGDYLYVDIIPINNFQTRVEVRAQLPYTQMDKLANKLDLIIQKYDDSAYFDHEDLGIITAYLKTDAYRKWHKKEDVELLEALSIEDAKRKIDQSPYQITIKAEAEDEFKDFLLSKNISFIIDDHLTAYGKHGKNSTFHLKYPKHKDLTEDTHLIN